MPERSSRPVIGDGTDPVAAGHNQVNFDRAECPSRLGSPSRLNKTAEGNPRSWAMMITVLTQLLQVLSVAVAAKFRIAGPQPGCVQVGGTVDQYDQRLASVKGSFCRRR